MPRKGPAPRRVVLPDPVHQSVLVSQVINKVLWEGKRSLAESIVYEAMTIASQKADAEPLVVLKRAMDNVRPALEVKSRRVGGATYQVPIEVKGPRANTLAIRWVVENSRKRREKTMAQRLGAELLDANNGVGTSVKKRDDMQKMAESNKAFAHYRW